MGSKTPCALVVMGVSGSGKSTIADHLAGRLGWRYEDGDRFHPASNVAKMSAGHPLTDEDRWPWLQAIADEIDRLCGKGQPAVVACSALKRAYRARVIGDRGGVRLVHLKGEPALIAASEDERVLWAGGFFDLTDAAYRPSDSILAMRALVTRWIVWLASSRT